MAIKIEDLNLTSMLSQVPLKIVAKQTAKNTVGYNSSIYKTLLTVGFSKIIFTDFCKDRFSS